MRGPRSSPSPYAGADPLVDPVHPVPPGFPSDRTPPEFTQPRIRFHPVAAAEGARNDQGVMNRFIPISLIVAALAAFACGGNPPAEEALDAAEKNVEQASDAIEDMQKSVQELESEQKDLREQLDSTVRRQAQLWEQQLAAYRERVTRLPADAEQRLKPELAALEDRVAELRQKLDAYATAVADAEPELRTEVETAIADLRTEFKEIERSLGEAAGE